MTVTPALAVTVALTAANMAMTAMQEFEGPRVKDAGTTLADYGTPMNYLIGTRLVSCPCFFAKPIREVKKKKKGKGGKQVTYSGYGTWAVHIADHTVDDVLQIWFDNHLIYDATGSDVKIYKLGSSKANDGWRFYIGTEDQEPDPNMLAYIEARDGPGTCPAYRGQSYIYFDNVPLQNLGNRYPDVKVMVGNGFPVTQTVNINAVTNAGTTNAAGIAAGVTIGGFNPAQVLKLTLPAEGVYSAWSPWNSPSPVGANSGSLTAFKVAGDGSTANVMSLGSSTLYDGYEAARQAFVTAYITGHSSYTFYFLDTPISDNGGGLSIEVETFAASGSASTLKALLDKVAQKANADPDAYDFSAADAVVINGYNWTQGTGKQICDAVCDLYDFDLVPHDGRLIAKARGGASIAAIPTAEFVRQGEALYKPTLPAPGDLPFRVYMTYKDTTADQGDNVACPPGPDPGSAGSARELSIDMSNLALAPADAQTLAARRLRRERIGATTSTFALTRQYLAIEPGDVWTPVFDDFAMAMKATKVILRADGVIDTEWRRELAEVSALVDQGGAPASGHDNGLPGNAAGTIGDILDVPLLTDALEQSAPFALVVAGPDAPGTWYGADIASSDTGELDSYAVGWDGVAGGDGSIIGTVAEVLPDVDPWMPDNGSAITVSINYGELTSATLDELQLDPNLNRCAIQSGDGWEIVQFMNATLTDVREYRLTGLLRGQRGTEWAMAGHAAGDRFVLLDTIRVHTMGASEVGDIDWYVFSGTDLEVDQATAVPVPYSGASHKPYAPVLGTQEQAGADLVFDAVRRTRIGAANLDGQDVPLGEASEAWELDIHDGTAVVRTIAATSLPIVYAEADQIADFGSAQASVEARLYQIDPTLNLRGYPLAYAA